MREVMAQVQEGHQNQSNVSGATGRLPAPLRHTQRLSASSAQQDPPFLNHGPPPLRSRMDPSCESRPHWVPDCPHRVPCSLQPSPPADHGAPTRAPLPHRSPPEQSQSLPSFLFSSPNLGPSSHQGHLGPPWWPGLPRRALSRQHEDTPSFQHFPVAHPPRPPLPLPPGPPHQRPQPSRGAGRALKSLCGTACVV